MPFVPYLLAAAGGAYFWNKIDDNIIDPVSQSTPAKSALFILAAGVLLVVAKKQRLI